MEKREKTKSKFWFDDEIHHVEIDENGNKIFHLHSWVKRTYNPYLLDYEFITHRNEYVDFLDKVKALYMKLYGGEDFEDRDNYNGKEN
jgi:hypothetical protein